MIRNSGYRYNQWSSAEMYANLYASRRPENGNAVARVSSSGSRDPQTEEKNADATAIYLEPDLEHYHFKLVSLVEPVRGSFEPRRKLEKIIWTPFRHSDKPLVESVSELGLAIFHSF